MGWVKSSHCSTGGCVAVWVKAGASGSDNCVEVQAGPAVVFVRDSKDPDGPCLAFTPAEWEAFLTGVRAGDFD